MGSAVCGHSKVTAVQTLDNKPHKLTDHTTDPYIGHKTDQENNTLADQNTHSQEDCKTGEEVENNIAQHFDHQSEQKSDQQLSETEYQRGGERTVFESTDQGLDMFASGKIKNHTTVEEKEQGVEGILEGDTLKADEMEDENSKPKEREVDRTKNEVESDVSDDGDDDGDDDDGDAEEGEGDGKKKKKKKLKLTAEELKELKDRTYGFLRKTVEEVMEIEERVNEDGYFAMKIRNAFLRCNQSYFSCKRTTLEDRVQYRLEIADILIETKFYEICCETLIKTYPKGWNDAEGKSDTKKYAPLVNGMLSLCNFTDQSEPLRMAVADYPAFLETLKQALEDYAPRHKLEQEPPLSVSLHCFYTFYRHT
ncbi:uncharacterized protein LOC128204768 [Mya arenaria]|uniref:uncharacterized protein LOC128204768 n=1 Tax=Mya arenaria TaxID=6604 RepID=UPI0022DF3B46|nr:uncharacterized protein LOC128204768 [Mya arenaria]